MKPSEEDAHGRGTIGSLESRAVADIDNEGTEKGTGKLSNPVYWDIGPGESAEDCQGKGDSRVEVGTLFIPTTVTKVVRWPVTISPSFFCSSHAVSRRFFCFAFASSTPHDRYCVAMMIFVNEG